MKLCRFGPADREKPGLIDADGRVRDLSGVIADLTPDALSPSAIKGRLMLALTAPH